LKGKRALIEKMGLSGTREEVMRGGGQCRGCDQQAGYDILKKSLSLRVGKAKDPGKLLS